MSEKMLAGWNVVVVDDDLFNAEMTAATLSDLGAAVHQAVNGQDGLALIERVRPEIVFTDLSMPIMDGWAMIEAMKRNPETADIPIIALTAHAMDDELEQLMAMGCHAYIIKPFTATSFEDRLEVILDELRR